MEWGFEPGIAYNRRTDLHERFGGQQQSGIITPSKHNVIFIISGKRGPEYGYNDRHYPDGRVEYFGEGQVGDMLFERGNKAIRDHAEDGKDILFFEKEYPDRNIVFRNQMICEGWHWEQSVDVEGNSRKAIVFDLRPLSTVTRSIEELPTEKTVSLGDLRALAFAAAAPSQPTAVAQRTVFQRSADVRNYVLARARGRCEGCNSDAPFRSKSGIPYLEPHHIRRVSDGGPDDPRFVISLCPTCHARVHRGEDGSEYNAKLLDSMAQIEP